MLAESCAQIYKRDCAQVMSEQALCCNSSVPRVIMLSARHKYIAASVLRLLLDQLFSGTRVCNDAVKQADLCMLHPAVHC